ncbi:MAG: methyltransferase [Candidatus Cloacimonetes bacterium]|nr:methyltransferase [Candidatus Cloacimonadota bacterium]MCF7814241.1 methyltransferase [Candidatus Cloacimonadota bacterium]MCF7868448.1 methyltransferase [Candidatus Cloacimonadota bacterium]MCF7883932.1 methyltransferase [Candidatus Cloacimonadota bacterium]
MKPVLLPFHKTIFQTDHGQAITSDTAFVVETILKRNFAKELKVLELGSGNGIISIMLAHYRPNWQITGIEIQQELVELSRSNAELSEVKTTFLQADLKEFQTSEKFDLIISNPPYFAKKEGRISPIKERAISRHEICCTMNDVFCCLKRNLKINGKAFLIYPTLRWKECEKNAKIVDLIIADKIIMPLEEQKERMMMELVHAEY